ncbi:MAG: NAD-dependent epimerase/dehydratase family protein [Magnetococcales bacterium]|nr:NAD-dependent epimerase/dehydratase family protein [Magnetococcales bacterium]
MFYKDKLCLVTGPSGFVGTHMVQALLAAGARVRAPVHERPMIVQDPQIELVTADLTDQGQCRRVMAGVQYVFHCAGAVSAAGVTVHNPMSAITANLTLTANVLEAAMATGVERILIFGSSTGYPVADYPIREEEMWSGPPHPSYFGYGWMRRYLECMAEFVHQRGVKVALVRPTAIYGRHDNFSADTSHVIPALIRKAVNGMDPFEVWGTGDEIRDFLHVEDMVRGCLLAVEKVSVFDPVNIGYGQVITVRDIVETILRVVGHDGRIFFDASKPTTIPVRMVDVTKAREWLGFEPSITLENGLMDTVKWFRDNCLVVK